MTDVQTAIDAVIDRLSEMSDDEVDALLSLAERTYVHTLIEKELRGAPPKVA
jgi:hypothetical protein